jgi:deoxyribonuclease IV
VLYGAHLSSAGGIHKAVERATERRCDALQVFTQSPRMWRPSAHAEETLASFREARAEAALGAVVCHAIYLVNLASPDEDVYEKSRATMRATVDTACAIEADGVVFHVGSHLGSGFDAALDRVVVALRELLEHCADRTWLLMENTAGAGGTIGRSVTELETIFDALDGHPRLGVCIDSCHWWASGIDVTDAVALDKAVRDLDSRVGLDRIRCLHVNDSQAPLASNRDRHENVGKGLIGNGLATFLAHPAFQALPAILETPGPDGHGPDAAEVRRLRQLHKRGVRVETGRSGARGSSGRARTST